MSLCRFTSEGTIKLLKGWARVRKHRRRGWPCFPQAPTKPSSVRCTPELIGWTWFALNMSCARAPINGGTSIKSSGK